MTRVLTIATALGVYGVIESFVFYWMVRDYFALAQPVMQALIFLKLLVSGHMTIYLTRNTGPVWERPWPSWKLVVPAEATQIVGTLVVVYGFFMAADRLAAGAHDLGVYDRLVLRRQRSQNRRLPDDRAPPRAASSPPGARRGLAVQSFPSCCSEQSGQRMRRVLVATDGSESADRAVDYAADLAKREKADLLIANVIGGYGLPDKAMLRLTQSEQAWLREFLDSLSAETLTKARERARAAGASTVQLELRAGDVAETLIHIAQEKAADVVVVGKRGAGLVERLLLGSVSQKLVSLAPLPVIIVP